MLLWRTDDELQKLSQLEIEYRNIPKEFDGDEYAKKTLKEIVRSKMTWKGRIEKSLER